MAFKVGITGGIGSGKSYVCQILEKLNYPVYYSDAASKILTDTHPIIQQGLLDLIGEEVYVDGKLNKPFLASKIFQDDELRMKVNALIHPIVRQDFSDFASSHSPGIVFNEAAILFETGAFKTLDFNVLVTADLEIRIERTMLRDGLSREEVLQRIAKQWEDEKKMELADFVIYNDGRPLLEQIDQLILVLNQRM